MQKTTKYNLNTFRVTYDEMPGDMPDEAASRWFGVTNFARLGPHIAGDGYIGGKS